MRAALLAALLGVSLSAAVVAQKTGTLAEGLEALDARDYSRAAGTLETALAAARQQKNQNREAEILFYLGLSWQKNGSLREAAESYEQALRLRTELREPTAPILNNLAQTYAALGDAPRADALFRKAVESGGRDAAVYQSTYASFLEAQGRRNEAASWYRRAAESDPANVKAHWRAVEAMTAMGEDLLPYLRCQLAGGQVDLALESALRLLEQGKRPASERSGLLTIVAAALARQLGDPRESPAVRRLDALREDPAIGPGVQEIQRLLTGDAAASCCDWWNMQLFGAPQATEAYVELLRALGRHAAPEAAELYLTRALDAGGPSPSPLAFLDLVELYYSTGEIDKLDRLTRQRSPALFDAKGQAYRRSAWSEAYDFHRALGMTYAHLGRWGDSRQLDSAIFQLEHARTAAARHNQDLRPPSPERCGDSLEREPEPITIEPGLIALLAESYEKVGRGDDAVRARLDSAEEYAKRGDRPSARRV
ncbi:MAG TPA: tetratricopeptide repeat protein, partial [Thermoanaerobaculia bacterium]|nr:tetratricopeptide repeat protein [Thermoanaerobaculia bacterium]